MNHKSLIHSLIYCIIVDFITLILIKRITCQISIKNEQFKSVSRIKVLSENTSCLLCLLAYFIYWSNKSLVNRLCLLIIFHSRPHLLIRNPFFVNFTEIVKNKACVDHSGQIKKVDIHCSPQQRKTCF